MKGGHAGVVGSGSLDQPHNGQIPPLVMLAHCTGSRLVITLNNAQLINSFNRTLKEIIVTNLNNSIIPGLTT